MYQYYNAEPNGEKLEDCVIRALSLALHIPYYDIVKMLLANGEYYQCDEICVDCYERLLEDMGYEKHDAKNRLVEDIALLGSIVLIRIEGHLTCAIDGVVYDIWDCSKKEVDCYWLINRGGDSMIEKIKDYIENLDLRTLSYEEIKVVTETLVLIEKYEKSEVIQNAITNEMNDLKATRIL